ncbi:hypothetical protein M422DRAFT_37506 [Sphaerobolus stellatus SS14]|uniref:Unplaced genomic scaffold SPHSTscaffold_244, whole genome shotgun sequence n=1 Tax=Sphaerobolus stellatus (strain SS14) TaxID=990650 RepID=A0A0C9URK7_SPHS4|nr:hypothetical protein M422DRAFT_37506 [Sphaerobolus stellatus SS14]
MATTPTKAKQDAGSDYKTSTDEEASITFKEFGVWTVMRQKSNVGSWLRLLGLKGFVQRFREDAPLIWHFIRECFQVSPHLVTVFLISSILSGMEISLDLYFSNHLLNCIQKMILKENVESSTLFIAVSCKIGIVCIAAILRSFMNRTSLVLSTRVDRHFDSRVLKAHLKLDLPTFQDKFTTERLNGVYGSCWEYLESLVKQLSTICGVITQLSLLFGILYHQPGGHILLATCTLRIFILQRRSAYDVWTGVCCGWTSNPHYLRMNSLMRMVTSEAHRIEVISDRLATYILREWKQATDLRGDLSSDSPSEISRAHTPIMTRISDYVSQDFPYVLYCIQLARSPDSFSLASVALFQNISRDLSATLLGLVEKQANLSMTLSKIKELYRVEDIPIAVLDGTEKFVRDEKSASRGMEMEFKNVSFKYPETTANAIEDVSFRVKEGQTLVIVGVNGSGKSTLLKLLNRLYDPSSGTIYIDGIPMKSLLVDELRSSTAMHYQSFSLYPFTLRENITMGATDNHGDPIEDNDERVAQAMDFGGSKGAIKKQPEGLDTLYNSEPPCLYTSGSSHALQAFQKKMQDIQKRIEFSTGETQRIALSRLFFRTASRRIRLVCVDEPSASLDPKMEYSLFERLRSLSTSEGKTLIYVTHRFGYLTKRADLILVMKDGQLVEQGKHNELLALDGEYAKLYSIQAEAFMLDD